MQFRIKIMIFKNLVLISKYEQKAKARSNTWPLVHKPSTCTKTTELWWFSTMSYDDFQQFENWLNQTILQNIKPPSLGSEIVP